MNAFVALVKKISHKSSVLDMSSQILESSAQYRVGLSAGYLSAGVFALIDIDGIPLVPGCGLWYSSAFNECAQECQDTEIDVKNAHKILNMHNHRNLTIKHNHVMSSHDERMFGHLFTELTTIDSGIVDSVSEAM